MCAILFHLILANSCLTDVIDQESPSIANQAVYERIASEQAACGPNALYLFLALHDRNVSYNDILKIIQRNNSGSTIAALVSACRMLGTKAEAVFIDWPTVDPRSINYPVIAHQILPGQKYGGHYVVILSCDGKRARYIDGTTGILLDQKWEWLRGRLTGNSIIAAEKGLAHSVTIFCLIGAACIMLFWRARGRLGFVSLLAMILTSSGTACADQVDRPDGSQALSLLLLAEGKGPKFGYAGDSGTSGAQKPIRSFADLKRTAEAGGLALEMTQVTPGDLKLLPTPFLTTLKFDESGDAVCLVHYIGGDYVDFIDDATVTFHRVRKADFIQDWTGVVAYPGRSGVAAWLASRWGILAGAGLGLAISGNVSRLLRKRKPAP